MFGRFGVLMGRSCFVVRCSVRSTHCRRGTGGRKRPAGTAPASETGEVQEEGISREAPEPVWRHWPASWLSRLCVSASQHLDVAEAGEHPVAFPLAQAALKLSDLVAPFSSLRVGGQASCARHQGPVRSVDEYVHVVEA